MERVNRLAILIYLLLFAAVAFGWHDDGSGRNVRRSYHPKPQRTFDWPGRYVCEQCAAKSAADCWKYELTILRGAETYQRGELLVNGPGEDLELKMHATPATGLDGLELHYVEPVDTSQSLPNFKKDELLAALEFGDRALVLRFGQLATKVDGQATIPCSKVR